MIVLFESQIYPDELISEINNKSKDIPDYAAHNLCKAINSGLLSNGVSVSLINVPNIGSFPFLYRSPRVPGSNMESGISIPFWNVSVLKRYDIRRKIYKEIKKRLSKIPDNENVFLLLYNFRSIHLVSKLKKSFPSLKVCLIVTDLPEFMLKPSSKILKIGESIIGDSKLDNESFCLIDGFILLAPAMREKLSMSNKPWIQIEGIYNSDTQVKKEIKELHKTILYTGNLGLRYGIGSLLEAFHQIKDDDFRLWICGGGDGLEEVKRYCSFDERIHYKGILSRSEVLCLQKKATVLVNPRNSNDDYTLYSFPSKTMEYMASGTPVIMSHLKSIPAEYDQHIYYVENETIEGLKKKLIEVCSKPPEELGIMGKAASDFIMKNKTPEPQMAKVVNFLSKI